MLAAFASKAPSWLCCLRGVVVARLVAPARRNFAAAAKEQLAYGGREVPQGAQAVRERLVEELEYCQTTLAADSFLLGEAVPTAADFTLYAMLERLCGDMGDVRLPNALPDLLDEAPSLTRLREWWEGMRASVPVRFKGKRT